MKKIGIPLSILIVCLVISILSFGKTYSISFSNGWNLIGIPFSSITPDSLIDSPLKNLILVNYSGPLTKVFSDSRIDQIKSGQGYWIWLPEPKTITLEGIPSLDINFAISLEKGWNLFSMPYSQSVCWNETNAVVNDGMGSLSSAIAAGPVAYSPESGYFPASVLRPWTAYWLKTGGHVDLKIKFNGTVCADNSDCPGEHAYCKNPCETNAECVSCSIPQNMGWNAVRHARLFQPRRLRRRR